MDKYCRVRGCSMKNTHVTKGHKCEICRNYGHGHLECENLNLRERLELFWQDIMNINDRCNFINCNNRLYHKTEGHQCFNCYGFGHTEDVCIKRFKELKCPICRTDNKIDMSQKKISGLNDECCICMDNKVEIYFNTCGHVCLCSSCFHQI